MARAVTFLLVSFCVVPSFVLVYVTSLTDPLAKQKVEIVVLLPEDNTFFFSVRKVRPIIDVSIETAKRRGFLDGVKLNVSYGDSNCTAKSAPFEAVKAIFSKKRLGLFLGPFCDYSLAPVARLAPLWHVAIVTPGGGALAFSEDKRAPDAEYPTLTRIGLTYDSMSKSLFYIFGHYHWFKIKYIYSPTETSRPTPQLYYLYSTALKFVMNDAWEMKSDFFLFHPESQTIEEMLMTEIGVDYADTLHNDAKIPGAYAAMHRNGGFNKFQTSPRDSESHVID